MSSVNDFKINDGQLVGYSGSDPDVEIPRGAERIATWAFDKFRDIESLSVNPGNKVLHGAGNCIIKTKEKELVLGCKNSVIPSDGSVTSIGYGAFKDCAGLTSIVIPDGVTKICPNAFFGCKDLTSVTIPDSVTEINFEAFKGCSGLTSITIPDSVRSIAKDAFSGCKGLTGVTIGSGVTSIGENAFVNTGYYNDLSNWEDGALYIDQWLIIAATDISGALSIRDGIVGIADNAFGRFNVACTGLTSVTIPDSVTKIGNSAFKGCSGLTSVTIPDSVTSIGNHAFEGCAGLTSVTIPDSVTEINFEAFKGCSGLTSVTIPESVTSIADSAFSGCAGLTCVTIPDSVTSIGRGAFSGCAGLTNITIPDTVTEICGIDPYSHKGVFEDCAGLTKIIIPESVRKIGENAFAKCANLKEITIPKSVKTVGKRAFEYCAGLTNAVISEGVTAIADGAFGHCSALAGIKIPESVKKIGKDAFVFCPGFVIRAVEGSYAADYASEHGLPCETFADAAALFAAPALAPVAADTPRELTVEELKKIWTVKDIDDYSCEVRGYKGNNAEVEVPAIIGSRDVKSLGLPSFFSNFKKIKKMIIPYGVEKIGEKSFEDCSMLESVVIPESVTTIEDNAFDGCRPGLTIRAPAGSYAEAYARENGIAFEAI